MEFPKPVVEERMYSRMMLELQSSFEQGIPQSTTFRLRNLKSLHKMYEECKREILAALMTDLKKPQFEGALAELEGLKADVRDMMRNLEKWAKPENLPFNFLLPDYRASIRKDPFGVVLIIGAWNYPFLLTLQPLHAAIAAGNCVVVKPSEISCASSSLINKMLTHYLDQKCYRTVEGGPKETSQLLEEKFDSIFATGGTRMGYIVMMAAAKYLTPVTLELGGKCPVIVDDTANLQMAAKRICWGKYLNLGQTCISADYILCSKKTEEELIKLMIKTMFDWHGQDMKLSPHLGRIVNSAHFERLRSLLERTKGTIAYGGEMDPLNLWISPTLIAGVLKSDALMQEEIFGPILPFVNVTSMEEAMKFVQNGPKPLAVYVFSKNSKVEKEFIQYTRTGSVVVNDVAMQNGYHGLPFGGVGESGMGTYHGKYSFDAFTHKKSVLVRSFSSMGEKLGSMRYPPYDLKNLKLLAFGNKYFRYFNFNRTAFEVLFIFLIVLLLVVISTRHLFN